MTRSGTFVMTSRAIYVVRPDGWKCARPDSIPRPDVVKVEIEGEMVTKRADLSYLAALLLGFLGSLPGL